MDNQQNPALQRQMLEFHQQGWDYLRRQLPDLAFDKYESGLKLALQVQDPCWELFFRFWQLETRTYYQERYPEALRIGIQATTLAYKAAYENCEMRNHVFYTMAELYSYIDILGYETEITQLLDILEESSAPLSDTQSRIIYLRANIAFAKGRIDAAEHLMGKFYQRVQYEIWRKTFFYVLMRRIAFYRGQLENALAYCIRAENHAITSRIEPVVGWNRIWKAAIFQRLGQEIQAKQAYHSAIVHYESHKITKSIDFYDAACDYQEQCADSEMALKLREGQALTMAEIGSIQYQCDCQLQTARLLGRMGQNPDAAIQKAKELARDLKKPSLFLESLTKVEAGNYYEYEWQKP